MTQAAPGCVVWLTGLPAAGKSTLAERLHRALVRRGIPVLVLDSDRVRSALVPTPSYEVQGRADFYETLARLAALCAQQGLIVLVPATAPLRAFRDRARALAPRFVEVLVDVPLEVCQARDPKGLYAQAATAQSSTLPGVGARYEPPLAPEVVAQGGEDDRALAAVLAQLGAA